MSDLADPRECGGVCLSGWIVIEAHRTQSYRDRDGVIREIPTSAAARCMCPLGRQLKVGAGIEQIFSESQLIDLYRHGIPVIETPEVLKRDAGIPKARWTWSFDTFKAAMGKRKEITAHVTAANAWVGAKVAARPDIVLYGPNGTGKTGLATVIGLALIARQEHVLFVEARALFMEWRETYGKTATVAETTFLDNMTKIPTLILDEAGETGLTEFTTTGLKLLVDRRQGAERPTIFTVNIPADAATPAAAAAHLSSVFGPALYDRLREHAQFWPLLGTTARKPSTKVLPFEPAAT
jgi:DNA replication protein DnaC